VGGCRTSCSRARVRPTRAQGQAGTVGALHRVVQVADELVQTLQLALRPASNTVPSTYLLEHRRADAKRRCRPSRGWGWPRGERDRSRFQWHGFRWEEAHMRRRRWACERAARSPECLATSSMAWCEEHTLDLSPSRLRQPAACPATARSQSVWLQRVQGGWNASPA